MSHHLRLVSDNSGGLAEQRRKQSLAGAKPAPLALKPNTSLPSGRKSFVAPVADSRHLNAKKARDGGCAAKRINDLGDGMQIISHTEEYSVSLKNVKRRNAESAKLSGGRIINVMASAIDLPQLLLIGLRLRAAREAFRNKSQADVCRALNVMTQRWNQWEKGKHPPDPLVMVQFADNYRSSLDWIYRGRLECITSTAHADLTNDRYQTLLREISATLPKTG